LEQGVVAVIVLLTPHHVRQHSAKIGWQQTHYKGKTPSCSQYAYIRRCCNAIATRTDTCTVPRRTHRHLSKPSEKELDSDQLMPFPPNRFQTRQQVELLQLKKPPPPFFLAIGPISF
jgi:hypothetical protein